MCHWNCFECRTLYTKNVKRSCICWRCLVASKMVNIFNLSNHTRSAVWTIWVLKRCDKSRKKTDPHIFWWICFFFCIQFGNFFLINSWWRRWLIGLTKSWTTEGKSYGMLNLPEIVRHICEALCHTKLTQTGHIHMWSNVPHWTQQKQDTLIYEALFHTELTKYRTHSYIKHCSTLNSPKKKDTLICEAVFHTELTKNRTKTKVKSCGLLNSPEAYDTDVSEELWHIQPAKNKSNIEVKSYGTLNSARETQYRSEELRHIELTKNKSNTEVKSCM